MSESLIHLKGVTRVVSTDEVDIHAPEGSDPQIERGERLSISGPFSCGKSTLLASPGLLDSPSGGNYLLRGFLMFRSIARVVLPVGMVCISILATLANAQVSPDLPNPIATPNPLTMTLSIFRSNMQDKIMKAADMMPESKYSLPADEKRSGSFAEIVTCMWRSILSYFLCSTMKGEATPRRGNCEEFEDRDPGRTLKGSFGYCDGARSPGSSMRILMTRRTSLATRRTRCSS